jgi:hypothetical protein
MSPNGYPFLSRRQILQRIDADPLFAVECVAILQERHERRTRGASTGSIGWMASHTARAVKLAAKLASGEATEKDRAEARQLARRYTKQLARVLRERELASRPELVAQAAVFGIRGGDPSTPDATSGSRSDEQPAPPKKRGRPKGSRNKPKVEPAPRRRRRA